MKFRQLRWTVILLLISFFSYIPPSFALPSPFEQELKLATKIEFGKPYPIALPDCELVVVKGRYKSKCSYGKFLVTVNSFKYHGTRTAFTDVLNNVYAISIKMENYSKTIDSGLDVGAVLRCKNEIKYSPFYRDEADSIDPQDVPAGTELSGVIYASLPDDFSPDQCQMPTLWLEPFNSGVSLKDKAQLAEIKKRKLVARAYLPLTPELLNSNLSNTPVSTVETSEGKKSESMLGDSLDKSIKDVQSEVAEAIAAADAATAAAEAATKAAKESAAAAKKRAAGKDRLGVNPNNSKSNSKELCKDIVRKYNTVRSVAVTDNGIDLKLMAKTYELVFKNQRCFSKSQLEEFRTSVKEIGQSPECFGGEDFATMAGLFGNEQWSYFCSSFKKISKLV
jgi:hypothetical protein